MFTLPKLPYGFSELEPHIDAKTMEIHYSKHHQAYVDNLNKALESHIELQNLSIQELLKRVQSLPEDIKQAVINNGGGHANHSFFWEILINPSESEANPVGEIEDAINSKFGSFDEFKSKFNEVATKRFGSGWAWLVKNQNGELEIYSTPNQDSPLMQNHTLVIGLDVWEHAYYLNYQNRRAEYIQNFWSIANWQKINENYLK